MGVSVQDMRISRRRFVVGSVASSLFLCLRSPAACSEAFEFVSSELLWAGVPGASVARLGGSGINADAFGLRDVASRLSTTTTTIFEAGSLSKPLFAYAVMGLVDQGRLDLHKSLDAYLPEPYPIADPRGSTITAHQVLTHTSGLPNWRSGDKGPLALSFAPGTAYQYSGEDFYFLQTVTEQITGLSTAQFMRQSMDKLGMQHSSYVWRDAYAADCARPYGRDLKPLSPDTASWVSSSSPWASASAFLLRRGGPNAFSLRFLIYDHRCHQCPTTPCRTQRGRF